MSSAQLWTCGGGPAFAGIVNSIAVIAPPVSSLETLISYRPPSIQRASLSLESRVTVFAAIHSSFPGLNGRDSLRLARASLRDRRHTPARWASRLRAGRRPRSPDVLIVRYPSHSKRRGDATAIAPVDPLVMSLRSRSLAA